MRKQSLVSRIYSLVIISTTLILSVLLLSSCSSINSTTDTKADEDRSTSVSSQAVAQSTAQQLTYVSNERFLDWNNDMISDSFAVDQNIYAESSGTYLVLSTLFDSNDNVLSTGNLADGSGVYSARYEMGAQLDEGSNSIPVYFTLSQVDETTNTDTCRIEISILEMTSNDELCSLSYITNAISFPFIQREAQKSA